MHGIHVQVLITLWKTELMGSVIVFCDSISYPTDQWIAELPEEIPIRII